MCKYCEHGNTVWYDDTTDYDGDGFIAKIRTDYEPMLSVEVYMDSSCQYDYITLPIHYCPVCGRKLD